MTMSYPHRPVLLADDKKASAAPGVQLMTLESSAHVIRYGECAM